MYPFDMPRGPARRHTENVLRASEVVPETHPPRPDVVSAPSHRPGSGQLELVERGAWSLVWLAVVTGGIDVWGFWWRSPLIGALAPLMALSGIVGTVWCWFTRVAALPGCSSV